MLLTEAPELCLSLSAPAGTRRVPRRQRTAGAGLCSGGHSHQTLSKAHAACPLHCLSPPLSRSACSRNALDSSRHPPAFASGTCAAAWCAHLREHCGPVSRRLPRCWSVSRHHPARAHSFHPDASALPLERVSGVGSPLTGRPAAQRGMGGAGARLLPPPSRLLSASVLPARRPLLPSKRLLNASIPPDLKRSFPLFFKN